MLVVCHFSDTPSVVLSFARKIGQAISATPQGFAYFVTSSRDVTCSRGHGDESVSPRIERDVTRLYPTYTHYIRLRGLIFMRKIHLDPIKAISGGNDNVVGLPWWNRAFESIP